MKARLGRWYKVTDNLHNPSNYLLILAEKKSKLGYIKTPIASYVLKADLPSRATAGYEDSDWRFGWLSTSKLMPADFRPKDTISESVARKAIRIIWS